MAQQLAQEAAKGKQKLNAEDIVPKHYHEFLEVFSKEKAKRFPTTQSWDHKIETKPDYEPRGCKIYPMSPTEQNSLDNWIKEMEDLKYIRRSNSPQASPYFVGKKNGKSRPVQDYQYINEWTIKNTYPIPLISEKLTN
jgi:hypothetical protein